MIDHMTFRVADIVATRGFYVAALAPLGYRLAFEGAYDGINMLGFGKDGKIDTWFIDNTRPISGPTHIAWAAASRADVDAFYAAAINAGGKDNGPPGIREHYHPNYYGAFVIDPNGHNVEAVCHQPQ